MNAVTTMKQWQADLVKIAKKVHEKYGGTKVSMDVHPDGFPWFWIADDAGNILVTINIKWVKRDTVLVQRINKGDKFIPFKISIDVVGDNISKDNFVRIVSGSKSIWNVYAGILNSILEIFGGE